MEDGPWLVKTPVIPRGPWDGARMVKGNLLVGHPGFTWRLPWVLPSGYDIHSLPWNIDGPNRNRRFTYLKWWIFPWRTVK